MQHIDTSRLKSAMIDAAILHADRMTRDDHDPIVIGEVYKEKWEQTVHEFQVRCRRKKRNVRVIAFIVAASLAALTGCAWIYRERIAEFVVTIFEKYDKVDYYTETEEYPSVIEEVYFPTYMLEGYELKSQKQELFKVSAIWKKSNEYLSYIQMTSEMNRHILDNEDGEYSIIQLGEYRVFHLCSDGLQYYTWENEYSFLLRSSRTLSIEELERLIYSIKIVEKNEEN